MKAVICKNLTKSDDPNCEIISEVKGRLRGFGIEAEFSESVRADCDLIITVGGDGTILHHGKAAAKLGLPLLGINTGRLGFMTSLEINELDKLELLKTKGFHICSRMMLDVEIGGQTHLALNDAVFYKDINSKLPDFKVHVNGTAISELRADGLILSTATGSTAYALSAGGPIIEPCMDCIELTPLCAHSLFNRPMILSAENPVTVHFDTRPSLKDAPDNHAVFISIDGGRGIPFGKGEYATVRKSQLRLSLIDLVGGSFYKAVSNKLMRPLK
ncbi:MAG: NAD(+)/NADH kinase [Oscillospiraceae bacterium]|jgi:NAD+ kinase|nr:NAD(+)/NADH kinase [Oscillospiraceae bacterium]